MADFFPGAPTELPDDSELPIWDELRDRLGDPLREWPEASPETSADNETESE